MCIKPFSQILNSHFEFMTTYLSIFTDIYSFFVTRYCLAWPPLPSILFGEIWKYLKDGVRLGRADQKDRKLWIVELHIFD